MGSDLEKLTFKFMYKSLCAQQPKQHLKEKKELK